MNECKSKDIALPHITEVHPEFALPRKRLATMILEMTEFEDKNRLNIKGVVDMLEQYDKSRSIEIAINKHDKIKKYDYLYSYISHT